MADQTIICAICNKKFIRKGSLNEHTRITHNNPNYIWKCLYCVPAQQFNTYDQLVDHNNSKHDNTFYFCSECDFNDIKRDKVKRHFDHDHKNRSWDCSLCDKIFKTQSGLHMHTRVIHNTEKWSCKDCKTNYNCLTSLQNHINIVHKKIKHKCGQCDSEFNNKFTLKQHMQYIHQNITYKCDRCDIKYKKKRHLREHIQTQHEYKKFECNKCGHQFDSSEGLRKHIHNHINLDLNQKYKCQQCEHRCSTRELLIKHIKELHGGIQCDICKLHVTKVDELASHIRTVHDHKYACKICNKIYTSPSVLNNHMKTKHIKTDRELLVENKIYKCEFCNKEFDRLKGVKLHIKNIHMSEKLECNQCEKILNNVESLLQHTIRMHVDKTKCTICGEFMQPYLLSKHNKKYHSDMYITISESTTLSTLLIDSLAEIKEEHILADDMKYQYNTDVYTKASRYFNQNDITNVKWWKYGRTDNNKIKRITEITCDNFILTCYPPLTSVHGGKCKDISIYLTLVTDWMKDNNIKCDIKPLNYCFSARHLKLGCPQFDIKVAVPDAPLATILLLLSNMACLKNSPLNIRFKNIDLKADYACCPTPSINIIMQQYKTDNNKYNIYYDGDIWPVIYVENDYTVGRDVYTYIIKLKNGSYVRSKIYNKFSQMIKTRGLRKKIGDSIPLWMHNNGPVLNQAIANKHVQKNGLSRLEFTYPGIPIMKQIHNLMGLMEKMYLLGCNKTSINKQWYQLSEYLYHTLVVYDCYTGRYILSRWKSGTDSAGHINGMDGTISKCDMRIFIQIISYCSFHDLPIDIILIAPTINYTLDNVIIETKSIPLDFSVLMNKGKRVIGPDKYDGQFLINYRYKKLRLFRSGVNKVTYFTGGSSLTTVRKKRCDNTSYLCDIKHICPKLLEKSISVKSKIYGINISQVIDPPAPIRHIDFDLDGLINMFDNDDDDDKILDEIKIPDSCILYDLDLKNKYARVTKKIRETKGLKLCSKIYNLDHSFAYNIDIHVNITACINIFDPIDIPFKFTINGAARDTNNNKIPNIILLSDNIYQSTPATLSKPGKSLDLVENKSYIIQNFWIKMFRKKKTVIFMLSTGHHYLSNDTFMTSLVDAMGKNNIKKYSDISQMSIKYNAYTYRNNKRPRFIVTLS